MDDLKHYAVQLDIPISGKKSEAGRGCFGAVFHSKINGAQCVVKKLHDILTGVGGNEYVAHAQWKDIADKFQTEIRLLSQQRHPNIVQFLGVCGLDGDPRDICLVMEQMDIDLDHFIEANKGGIPLELKLRILTDTASGVSHLHANGIVHRDLNSGNVLLSSSLQAKVADLGVSRIIDIRAVGRLTKAPGATEYMPPEALRDRPLYGPKLDCFSFGHLMLYLALEIYPQPREPSMRTLLLQRREGGEALEGIQFQKRRQWFEQLGSEHPLYQITVICLQDEPDPRWEMRRIRENLGEISKKHSKDFPKVMDLFREIEHQRCVNEELKKQHEVSEATERIAELQREIQKLELIVDDKEEVIKQVTNELGGKNKLFQQQHEELQIQKFEIEAAKADMTGMRSELSMKDIEMQELRVGLKEANDVLQSSLDDKQQSLLAANELAKKLMDHSDESTRAVNTKQREIDELQQEIQEKDRLLSDKVLSLQNELEMEKAQAQLYKEDFHNERSDRTKAHEEYTENVIQYKAIIKQLKDEVGKNATTITQLEEVKKSLRENEDLKKNWDEERAGIDQQLRAYKRQVDDLRRQLNEEKEKQKKLQESLDKKIGMEDKFMEYDAMIHDLKVELAEEVKNKDHLLGGVKKLQQELNEANMKCQDMEKMRNANMRLQHKLRESWDKQAALAQELRSRTVLIEGQTGDTHRARLGGGPAYQQQQSTILNMEIHDLQVKLAEEVKNKDHLLGGVKKLQHEANIKCQDMEKMKNANMRLQHKLRESWDKQAALEQELNQLRTVLNQRQIGDDIVAGGVPYVYPVHIPEHTKREQMRDHWLYQFQLGNIHSNVGIGSRTNIDQGQTRTKVEMESQHPHQQVSNDSDKILENAFVFAVDEDIQKYADDIRRMTQPQQTREFTEIEDTSLPYDPNLVCPKCGKRYRIGEVQKFGRHVNEFCTAK